jgi:hypothetical protein
MNDAKYIGLDVHQATIASHRRHGGWEHVYHRSTSHTLLRDVASSQVVKSDECGCTGGCD